MMSKERFLYLCQLYKTSSCSEDEMAELRAYLVHPDYREQANELLDESWNHLALQHLEDFSPEQADHFFEQILDRAGYKPMVRYYRWLKIAAIALLFGTAGLLIWNYRKDQRVKKQLATTYRHDVLPGGDKAILTLSGGRHIILDSSRNGQIARQGGILVSKVNNGQLVYASAEKSQSNSAQELNTITVPKGGQYAVTLADGTKVFLNSASSITFPASFPGRQRNVSLTGEAYFEVAKNPKKPFIVNVAGKEQVEVLGTHFNIEAYGDESAINTTLLEGSVRLTYGEQQKFLKPGQIASAAGTDLQISEADEDEVMAWRNGIFIFNSENIRSLMKRVSRWYNIDVVFKGDVSGANVSGSYSRTKSLANLLKNIELAGKVNFEIEERRVIVIGK